jgi:hypothetical protein
VLLVSVGREKRWPVTGPRRGHSSSVQPQLDQRLGGYEVPHWLVGFGADHRGRQEIQSSAWGALEVQVNEEKVLR